MSTETFNPSDMEREEESFDFTSLVMKYIVYWPWFVISAVICVIIAFIYLRYQTPVYSIESSVLIKEEDKKSNSANNPLAAIQDLGMFSMSNNFDNEVEILHSRTLIKKVVTELGLYINTSEVRSFGYNIPLYKDEPVSVHLTPEEAEKLEGAARLCYTLSPDGALSVKAVYTINQEEESVEKTFDKLPAVLPTPVGVFSFSRNDSVTMPQKKTDYKTVIGSPTGTAAAYTRALSIAPTSKTTTIAALTLQDSNKKRATDFINCLVNFYNRDANDEKNEVAQKTAEFIEERIGIINSELGNAENQLANFKQRSGLTDLTSDAKLALEENSKYQQQRVQNETQIQLVQFLRNYINDPQNKNEVIPSNVGLEDQTLSSVINEYNTMLIERKRLLLTSSENNPAVINMNTGIEAMRKSVTTTVESVLKGLTITKDDLERQNRKFEGKISNAPQQEKEFLTISRQQEIKAQLYIMLLQKREENAITLAATANNGRIVEEPLAGIAPVAPKKSIILLVALMVGCAIPVGILYLISLLHYKIETREDVEAITKLPIIGDIPMTPEAKKGSIVVHENRNDLMEEVFRSIRTNVQYMLGEGQKVILYTSTSSGEGKSFNCGNLACSFAFMGKKVVVVGLDIRKPGLNKVFHLSTKDRGITQYLSNPDKEDLLGLCQQSDISPNLYILPGGAIPPNPTELVARPTLKNAIDILRDNFDYVILDTAPIGMVTDTQLIARCADMSVYVCRSGFTPKSEFQIISHLEKDGRLPNPCIILNGIDMSKRVTSSYYGYGKYGKYGRYGYGNKGGYGRKYGYGYGYGYGKDSESQK